jgi:hypothetical protein
MKKTTLMIVLLFIYVSVNAERKRIEISNFIKNDSPDTTFYPFSTFDAINLTQYYNKPVDTFLAHLPVGYVLSTLLPIDNLKRRVQICAEYGNHIEFYIVVKDFHYMNPFSSTGIWDETLFRKENINRIEFYKLGDCIKGCD